MTTHVLDVAIKVRGPLLTRSMEATVVGLDAHGLQQNGCPALSGDHIRGHLQHALDAIVDLLGDAHAVVGAKGSLRRLLGDASAQQSDDAPLRRSLRFPHMFLADKPASGGRRLHRIKLHEDGRAEDGMLLVLHSPLAPGEPATFRGKLKVTAAALGEIKVDELAKWLTKLFWFVPAVGSGKGIGFGKIESVTVTAGSDDVSKVDVKFDLPQGTPISQPARIGLLFKLDRPFCFAKPQLHDNNRFDSLPYVPGAALLGALLNHAHAHSKAPDCALILEHQENLRFTHAQALGPLDAATGDGPMPILQSWVHVDGTFYDVALMDGFAPIDDRAPAFETDWKPADYAALEKQGVRRPSYLPSELIVRTAINPDTGSAEESKLFALQCYRAGDTFFGGDITLSAGTVAENTRLLGALQRVLPQALHSLGKTKAEATQLQLREAFLSLPTSGLKVTQRIILELHSDAALPIQTAGIPPSGGATALTAAYANVFKILSDDSLTLLRHFSRQRYVGGPYLHRRFWQSLQRGYRPLLLTQTGSVFVFEVNDAGKAQARLDRWALEGLPVGDTESLSGVPNWTLNPYRRQNGYGEMRFRVVDEETPAAPRPLATPTENPA